MLNIRHVILILCVSLYTVSCSKKSPFIGDPSYGLDTFPGEIYDTEIPLPSNKDIGLLAIPVKTTRESNLNTNFDIGYILSSSLDPDFSIEYTPSTTKHFIFSGELKPGKYWIDQANSFRYPVIHNNENKVQKNTLFSSIVFEIFPGQITVPARIIEIEQSSDSFYRKRQSETSRLGFEWKRKYNQYESIGTRLQAKELNVQERDSYIKLLMGMDNINYWEVIGVDGKLAPRGFHKRHQ